MQFFPDKRSISHVQREKDAPAYTLIFPVSDTLEQRLEVLEAMVNEVRKGIWAQEAKAKAEADKAAEAEAEKPVEIKENTVVEEKEEKKPE